MPQSPSCLVASRDFVYLLTLFCRFGLADPDMMIRATPACPYLAAVWRGVSPYCKTIKEIKTFMTHITLKDFSIQRRADVSIHLWITLSPSRYIVWKCNKIYAAKCKDLEFKPH